MTKGEEAVRNRKYGYAIVDKYGNPWWDEMCVCDHIGPMRETCANLNDRLIQSEDSRLRAPFRVVKLFWKSKKVKQ